MQRTGEFQKMFILVFAGALASCGKSVRVANVSSQKDSAAENSALNDSDSSSQLGEPLIEKQNSSDQQLSAPVNIAGANLVSFECRDFALTNGKPEVACVSQWDPQRGQVTTADLRNLSFAAREANGVTLPLQFSSLVFGSAQVLHFASLASLPAATLQSLQTGAMQSAPTIQIGQKEPEGTRVATLAVTPLLSLNAFPMQKNPEIGSAFFEKVLLSEETSLLPALEHTFVEEANAEALAKGKVAELGPGLSSQDLSSSELHARCQSAEVKTSSATILAFEPVGEGCLFGKAGNRLKKDKVFAARSEFSSVLTAPQGVVVCSVEFAFRSANFSFSDNIKLSVADQTVARSFGGAGSLSDDWNSLQGRPFDESQSSYCAAGVENCKIPVGGQAAELNVTGRLSGFAVPPRKISIGMTVYGDRDSSDCKHSGANVSLRYNYVTVD